MTGPLPPVDDEQVARAIATGAHDDDPSIDVDAGTQLALVCLGLLRTKPSMTAADLARELLRAVPESDVSWVNHVARFTCTYRF